MYFAIWNILQTYFTIYLYISFHCERWVSCCMTNPTKWSVHPVNTQPSLGIRPIWSPLGPYSYPLSAQRRLRSDWIDAQSDLCLRWVHRSFCLFCHASAQMVLMNTAIFSFSNTDKLCPIILNYAVLKHLTCEDLFTVANYLWFLTLFKYVLLKIEPNVVRSPLSAGGPN